MQRHRYVQGLQHRGAPTGVLGLQWVGMLTYYVNINMSHYLPDILRHMTCWEMEPGLFYAMHGRGCMAGCQRGDGPIACHTAVALQLLVAFTLITSRVQAAH